MKYKFVIPIILVAIFFVIVSHAITDEEYEEHMKSVWRIHVTLDMPDLEPHAVQYAIFDEDPIPGFKKRVQITKDFYKKRMEEANDEQERQMWKSSAMKTSWNNCFDVITGDNVFLLPKEEMFSSNAPEGKKWLVTKVVYVVGEPTCWFIPIEVAVDREIEVVLNKDNIFDLAGLYEAAMSQEVEKEK